MSSIRERKAVPGRAAGAPIMWSWCEVIFVSWQPITRSKAGTIRLIAAKFNRTGGASDFVIRSAIDADLAGEVDRNADGYWPTANETVFDVLLIFN